MEQEASSADTNIESPFARLSREADRLGWRWAIGYRLLKRIGISEVKLWSVGIDTPVYCRVEGSDIYEYKQALGDWAEPLDLHTSPKTIVDAGANVGYVTLRFASEYPNAKIIAVEPVLENQIQFRKNCSSYPNVVLEPVALWSHSVNLKIRSMDVSHDAYQVVEDAAGDIPAIGMVDLMAKHRIDRIDLLKVDIEGSERQLFDDPDAATWLSRVGMLLIETHDRIVPGCSDSVRRALDGLGTFQGRRNEYEYFLLRPQE